MDQEDEDAGGRVRAGDGHRHIHEPPAGSARRGGSAAWRELAGRDLMCWCPEGQPCHADVLLAIANSEAKAS